MSKKDEDELLIRVAVGFTRDQLRWLNRQSVYGRSAVLRELVRREMERELVAPDLEMEIGPVPDVEYATELDFEIAFNAHANIFSEAILEIFRDGRDISAIAPTFAGLVEKIIRKPSKIDDVERFLHRKMMILGSSQ